MTDPEHDYEVHSNSYEIRHNGYLYHLYETKSGVFAKRTPDVDKPVWNDTSVVQLPDTVSFDSFSWKPSNKVSAVYVFEYLDEAMRSIKV